MIWRRGTRTEQQSTPGEDTEAAGGKGRPTPSRKQAETERKERLKASSGLAPTSARARSTGGQSRSARADTRKRIIAGDERALTARDAGPERRYARDLVDERHTVGEYFLYAAMAVLVLGLAPFGVFQLLSRVLLIGIVLALVADSFLIRARVTRAVEEKFPGGRLEGIGRYALMRGMVTRRMRVPKPQVQRRRRAGAR